jgi:hypothetical protein
MDINECYAEKRNCSKNPEIKKKSAYIVMQRNSSELLLQETVIRCNTRVDLSLQKGLNMKVDQKHCACYLAGTMVEISSNDAYTIIQ